MKITRNGWHVMGIAAAAIALFGVALALVDSPARNYVAEAFGPIALVSEPNPDDAAGDALVPSDNSDQSLAILAPLDDERVVAALAPIANLACRRDDPVSAASSGDRGRIKCDSRGVMYDARRGLLRVSEHQKGARQTRPGGTRHLSY